MFVFFLCVYLFENSFFFHTIRSDQFALPPLLPAFPILLFPSLPQNHSPSVSFIKEQASKKQQQTRQNKIQ